MIDHDEHIRSDHDLADDYRRGLEASDRVVADYQRCNDALRIERDRLRDIIQNIHENTAGWERLTFDQAQFKLRVVHDRTAYQEPLP